MAARHGHDVHDARLLATLFQLARVGLVDSGAGEDVLSQQAEGDARHEHTALVVQAGGDGEEARTECFDAMPPWHRRLMHGGRVRGEDDAGRVPGGALCGAVHGVARALFNHGAHAPARLQCR